MSRDLHPAVHILCFEEAGDCTLERVAREARPGDAVAVYGPAAFVERLRGFGLKDGVLVAHSNRVAGSWWMAHGARALEDELRAALETAPRAEHARSPDAPPRRIAYGPRAQWLSARDARGQFNARPPFPLPDAVAAEAAPLACMPAALPLFMAATAGGPTAGTAGGAPDAAAWPEGRRARIRRELGLAPHECAVLLAGDPSEWIDLHFATRALAMARVGGAPLRMVASPRSARVGQMSAFLASAAQSRPIVVDERADRPWELLPALEASIHDQDGVATLPLHCKGWRELAEGERSFAAQPMSPLPALWSLACGRPAFVHESIGLGAHAAHPLVHRFGDDVAQLARGLHALASSASAASR